MFDLSDLLFDVLPQATPRALGRMILDTDPQAARIAAGDRNRLVDTALADGQSMACMAAAKWGSDPEVVARCLGLPVIESGAEGGYGSTVVYAEYGGRPPRIVLYRAALARVDRLLAQGEVGELAGLSAARPVYLAHELYHHLDLARGNAALAQRERVTLLRLGGFRWTSGLAALAEIAAGVFAQRLLGLRFHPKLFDLLTQTTARKPRLSGRG
jgi:hypothetical protein